jgi:hypothetical protein
MAPHSAMAQTSLHYIRAHALALRRARREREAQASAGKGEADAPTPPVSARSSVTSRPRAPSSLPRAASYQHVCGTMLQSARSACSRAASQQRAFGSEPLSAAPSRPRSRQPPARTASGAARAPADADPRPHTAQTPPAGPRPPRSPQRPASPRVAAPTAADARGPASTQPPAAPASAESLPQPVPRPPLATRSLDSPAVGERAQRPLTARALDGFRLTQRERLTELEQVTCGQKRSEYARRGEARRGEARLRRPWARRLRGSDTLTHLPALCVVRCVGSVGARGHSGRVGRASDQYSCRARGGWRGQRALARPRLHFCARCVALRCVALRCVALRCVALRCVALRRVLVGLR